MRLANAFMSALLRRGVQAGGNVLLTVPGRKSGQPRTTPVTVLTWNGDRYLQSPFGEVDWVRNLRTAGGATLTRGRWTEVILAVEVSSAEAAQVYKATIASYPAFIKNHFDVTPDAPIEAFEAEARRHPMFRIAAAPLAPPPDRRERP
ncbi:MAG TPA: nitroreductase family deazaflavin-dependent oxidoreductase [Thermomicrobiales bacterium]|nr:nitroreductase family deazaflavin-dependent oxidoreductase [Thermomicrobiales bacterium]